MTLLLARDSYPGVAPAIIRQAAGVLWRLQSAQLYDLCVALGAPAAQVSPIWEQLASEKRLAQDERGHWRPTDAMHTLATARIGKGLPRSKASKLLEELVKRAKEANARPATDDHYYVTRLAVFGSYLDPNKQELGDLDVAWELAERPSSRMLFIDAIMYGRDPISPTRALVRPKSPYVRMVEYGTLQRLKCTYQEIYHFEPPPLDQDKYDAVRRLQRERYRILDALWGDSFSWPEDLYLRRMAGDWSDDETDSWIRRGTATYVSEAGNTSHRACITLQFQPGAPALALAQLAVEGRSPVTLYTAGKGTRPRTR